jgi:hypothetical protein
VGKPVDPEWLRVHGIQRKQREEEARKKHCPPPRRGRAQRYAAQRRPAPRCPGARSPRATSPRATHSQARPHEHRSHEHHPHEHHPHEHHPHERRPRAHRSTHTPGNGAGRRWRSAPPWGVCPCETNPIEANRKPRFGAAGREMCHFGARVVDGTKPTPGRIDRRYNRR